MIYDTKPGQSFPLGATIRNGGVNFCVFSKNATAIELLLFDDHKSSSPSAIIPLDPKINRTFYYWHIYVQGIQCGQMYGYRVHGPFTPEDGNRFDPGKVLVDPYTKSVMYSDNYDREQARGPWNNTAQSMKSVVVDTTAYNWEGDVPLSRPFAESVIYEMHVRGFTNHPSSGLPPEKCGTYAGLIEKIDYLQNLGINTVELLPIHQFDDQDAPPGLTNFWGYQTIAFFAPHRGFSSDKSPLGPINEFRDMVKALHQAGIEVILDVVFNHTAEGGGNGPTLSFRGFENQAYYLLEPDMVNYKNYSGAGNTVNANQSIVRRLILDSLRFWVQEMHVDGFRFDLASVFSRDKYGNLLEDPPILWEIESDPVLAGTKIIAEAWDAGGLYQVGSFIGHRWAEWNGKFRDDVRKFIKGDENSVANLAARIVASPDIFPQPDREPNRSINFITAHDGFTLHDLVSYNQKHNLANGEFNRDGLDTNFSWNCGVEGPTEIPEVRNLRTRQMKNFLVVLMLSQGTPMVLMGDEISHTKYGNNNTYCQDNELNWINWDLHPAQREMLRFTRELIKFSQKLSMLRAEQYLTHLYPVPPNLSGLTSTSSQTATKGKTTSIAWHGVKLNDPDWNPKSHSLAFQINHFKCEECLYVILNAYWEPLTFQIPDAPQFTKWFRMVDTSLRSPEDITIGESSQEVRGRSINVPPRTAIVLSSKPA